jgi:Na+-driven multidrug efflux pump
VTSLAPLRIRDLRAHWRPTFRLAWPVVLGQLGVMLMSLVDTAMVGALGRNAVGAVGLASSLFGVAFLFGIGLLMGLDHEVSVAFGARREEDVARYAVQGLWLALAISLPLTAALLVASGHMHRLGAAPELVPPTNMARPSLSIHSRALALATSALFWWSALSTSMLRPSTLPPKSCTAIRTISAPAGPSMSA